MAIRVLTAGEIKCDACGKQIGTIKTTTNLMKSFEEEQRFTAIRCMDCSEKPLQQIT